MEDDRAVTGGEVDRLEVDQRGDVREQAAERDVLTERDQLALHVDRHRAAAGQPQLAGVAERILQQRPDQHRTVDGRHRAGDRGVDGRVLARVEVGRVLRPDHQVGGGPGARGDLRGQGPGGGGVILGHGGRAEQALHRPGVRDVALHRGHRRGALPGPGPVHREQGAREGHPGCGRRGRRREDQAAPAGAPAQDQPGQHRPGQCDQEGKQRGPADRGPARGGRARLAHRQAAPGEGIGPAGPQRLGRHPPGGYRQRPAGQPEQEPLAHRQQPEDHRLGDGQRGPRVPGHVDQPGQQGHEEGDPEDQPDEERGPQPLAVQRDHQQGRPGRRQRPEPGRRERGRQGQAAGHGGQQGPGQPQPVPPQPGQARGDAAGHGGDPPGGGDTAGASLRDLLHGQSVAGYAGLMPPPMPPLPPVSGAIARDRGSLA